jgi:ABC-2 type transport system permease protein
MQNILIIARRDLRAHFNSPVAYVVLGGTMLLLGYLFFIAPHMAVSGTSVGGFWEIDRATMDQMFTYLPVLMSLFVIPAVTMRSLAAEKGSGTLELLITMPVKDSEVILGKYLAACAMVLVLLAATLLYPIAMFKWPWQLGSLDWGPVFSGYLGCLFLGAAAVGVGLMFSSLTESDVVAFFLTTGRSPSFTRSAGSPRRFTARSETPSTSSRFKLATSRSREGSSTLEPSFTSHR